MIDVETIFDSDREEYEFMQERKEQPMKEQIEEMGKLCPFYEEGKCNLLEDEAAECNFDCDMFDFARTLYNAGYRKQKHGTWYHGTENGAVYAKCSSCGRKMDYSCYGYAYCALCGARMDGAKMKGGTE